MPLDDLRRSCLAESGSGHATTDPLTPKRRRRRIRPLVADAKLLATLLGVGVRSIRTWASADLLPAPVRLGSRVVWVLDGPTGIRAWLAAGAPDRLTWDQFRLRK